MNALDPFLVVLVAVHLLAAVFLVGGSLFIWLVVVPASPGFGIDEGQRTRIIGLIAKRFGPYVYASLAALIGTGIPIAFIELETPEALVATPFGRQLLLKAGLVALFLVLLYLHNVVFGRRITALARDGRIEELRRLRRTSRPIAYANLSLLVAILLLGILLHFSHA